MRIHGIVSPTGSLVRIDGHYLDPARSLAVFNHSPDGFSWGYGGSGPSQLALAILLEAELGDDLAIRLHHRFRDEFIAPLTQNANFEIDVEIAMWCYQRGLEDAPGLIARARATAARGELL